MNTAPSTSQGSPAASTLKGSPESSHRHTPEDLRPYPKAAPRKANATKRRKRKSANITDTPEKEELLNRRKVNIVTKPKRAKKTCLPFAQDKHVDLDASRPGTGHTDIDNDRSGTGHTDMDNDRQDDRDIRDTDVEEERDIRDTDVIDERDIRDTDVEDEPK